MKKGISLIVLVITIIVMIIIAGAIIISLSNSNVIDKADDAVSETNKKAAVTVAALGKSEYILKDGNNYSTGIDETATSSEAENAAGVVAYINAKLVDGGATNFIVEYNFNEDVTPAKHEIVLYYDANANSMRDDNEQVAVI